jgi:AcrR family transcriptional regulator
MSPRPYKPGQRQLATEQTRARILAAARALLMARDGFTNFSIEAIARQADVARMTVYYQFGSKVGLLEALCDTLAVNGGMQHLASAFQLPDPLDALAEYIRVFCRFWESDRLVTHRLRGLAALDPDFEQVIRARDERRSQGLRVLVGRIAEKYGYPSPDTFDETINILLTLTSFECCDMLTGPDRGIEAVAATVVKLARSTLTQSEK